jgi:ketosteroid isomerase-like protein
LKSIAEFRHPPARAEPIAPTQEELMTKARTEDVLAREKEFWNAMKAKDARGTQRLTDDDCIVVGPQGVMSIDPEHMARMTEEGTWTLEEYSVDERNAQVRFLSDDVALVAYRVSEKLEVDGKPIELDANDASVWVRRNGDWLCAMHTESLVGDPFGRDRTAPAQAR